MSRFHVRLRDGWEPTDDGPAFYPHLPGRDTVVGRFSTFAEADAERGRLEAEARTKANPFRLNGPAHFYQTSLDRPRLLDWLLDHDLPLPADAEDEAFSFAAWFDRVSATLTDTHRAAVWSACDKLRFYAVTDDPGSAYAVLELIWIEADDETATVRTTAEGGRLVGIHPDPRTSQKQAERLTRAVQDAPPFAGELEDFVWLYDVGSFREPDGEPTAAEDTAFHEIVEIPLHGPFPGWVVTRAAYDLEAGIGLPLTDDAEGTGARVPIRAFGDRGSATAFRDTLAADARRTVNPFRLLDPHGDWHLPLLGPDSDRLPDGRTLEAAALSVRRLTLDPPPPAEPEHWAGWYDRIVGELPAETIAVVWDAFAGFRLFEVEAAPDR